MTGVELTGVAGWMASVLAAVGPPGVGLIILVENLFPPIPSEAVLPAAGFLAAEGEFGVVAAAVWATVGSVAGALLLYGAGRWVGDQRMTALIDRIPLMSAADADKAWSVFDRLGDRAVLWGRLVPGVRSLVSVPAGARRMGPAPFLVRTLLGSAVWNSVLVGAGFWLGDSYGATVSVAEWANRLVYLAVAVGVAVLVGRRVRSRISQHRAGLSSDDSTPGPGTAGAASAATPPGSPEVPPDPAMRRPVRVRRPGEPARVLLIEDDRRFGRVIRGLLEEDGYDITWADRLRIAIEALGTGDYDVVVSDFDLPDGTGLDVLRASVCPVVVCTGRDEPEVLRLVWYEGAVEVLIKPFSHLELRSVLAAIVDPS